MHNLAKKTIACSLAVLLQLGLAASVSEAASLSPTPAHKQQDNRYHKNDNDRRLHNQKENERRKQERDHKIRIENERHKREMKRRPNESYRHWKERQKHEQRRHEHALREIQRYR